MEKEEKKFTYTDMLNFAQHLMTNLLIKNREDGIGEISDEDLIRIRKVLSQYITLKEVGQRREQLKCPQCGSTDVRSHSEGKICGDCNYVAWTF